MKHPIRNLMTLIVYFLLYLPVAVLVAYAFNDAKYSLIWHGFTSKWYQLLLEDNSLWQALCNSLILALLSSIIACIISYLACVQLFICKSKLSSIIKLSSLLVILVPDIIFAVALLLFFRISNIQLGFYSLLIAHVSFCIPFAVITINTLLTSLDNKLYLAASDLGASYQTMLMKILLPLCLPAIISAFLLCFTLSFDDVIISYFVSGPVFEILPLKIYSMIRSGITPEINALCSIILIGSSIIVAIAYYLTSKKTQ